MRAFFAKYGGIFFKFAHLSHIRRVDVELTSVMGMIMCLGGLTIGDVEVYERPKCSLARTFKKIL